MCPYCPPVEHKWCGVHIIAENCGKRNCKHSTVCPICLLVNRRDTNFNDIAVLVEKKGTNLLSGKWRDSTVQTVKQFDLVVMAASNITDTDPVNTTSV